MNNLGQLFGNRGWRPLCFAAEAALQSIDNKGSARPSPKLQSRNSFSSQFFTESEAQPPRRAKARWTMLANDSELCAARAGEASPSRLPCKPLITKGRRTHRGSFDRATSFSLSGLRKPERHTHQTEQAPRSQPRFAFRFAKPYTVTLMPSRAPRGGRPRRTG